MNKKVGKALVVGAGISGIRSALDLAETGYGVTLIDRSPYLGGILSQLDYQFPTDRCAACVRCFHSLTGMPLPSTVCEKDCFTKILKSSFPRN